MRDLHLAYDEEGDILYMSFGSNRSASSLSLNDNVVLRYDAQAHEAVGMTIIGFSDLLALERRAKMLSLRNLAELPHELGALVWDLVTQPPVNLYLQVTEDNHLATRLTHLSLVDVLLAA